MRVTEISYKGMSRSARLEEYISERVKHLGRLMDGAVSCRVAVEVAQHRHKTGNPFRMRVEVTVPRGHDLVAVKERRDEELEHGLRTLARDVFDALDKQARKTAEKRRGEMKAHETEEPAAFVVRMFRDKGFGFIQTVQGDEYYFHKRSVLHDAFEQLEVGTQVRFASEVGREGPQATTVQVVEGGKRARNGRVETGG